MICKKCGNEVDTSIRAVDGTVQCNKCGTIYRPKVTNAPSTLREADQGNQEESMGRERNIPLDLSSRHCRSPERNSLRASGNITNVKINRQSFLTNKFLSLPLWSWICALVLIAGGLVGIFLSGNQSKKSPAGSDSYVAGQHYDDSSLNYSASNLTTTDDYYDPEYFNDTYEGNDEIDSTPEETRTKVEIWIDNGEPFSEGRAWVTYNWNREPCFAMIDEFGQILYREKCGNLDFSGSKVYFTPFENGYSCVYDSVTQYFDKNNHGFFIIDKNGRIVFDSRNDKSSTYIYAGSGDSIVLYFKLTETFSESKFELYSMDMNGLSTFIQSITGNTTHEPFIYLGDSVFTRSVRTFIENIGWEYITQVYNSKTKTFFVLNDAIPKKRFENINPIYPRFKIPFEDGVTLDSVFGIPIKSSAFTDRASVYACFAENAISLTRYNYPEDENFGDGLYYRSNQGWLDLSGNVAVQLPSFPGTVSIERVGAFSGGYAPIVLRGADGKYYVTIIDKSGKTQYEPVQVNNPGRRPEAYKRCFYNGYFYINTTDDQLITPKGVSLSLTTSDLSSLGDDAYLKFGFDNILSNGYIKYKEGKNMNARYESLDRSRKIETVYYYE